MLSALARAAPIRGRLGSAPLRYPPRAAAVLYALATVGFLLAGLVFARWWVIGLPVLVWTGWALGKKARWWGAPPGEFLLRGTVLLCLIGMLAAGAGVSARIASRRLRR